MEVIRITYRKFKSLSRVLKFLYWCCVNVCYALKLLDVYKIPVVINNFNRLTYPLKLIEFLEKCGMRNIIILDNNSTYPPLLAYYEKCKYPVISDGTNYGHLALWKSGLYKRIKWNYFVYTDSDVVPIEECPKNFIAYFKSVLDKRYVLDKVGFGIKIDDLPDTFALKEKVVDYEQRYWQNPIGNNLYDAKIDTTFALYKPLSGLKWNEISKLGGGGGGMGEDFYKS
jgi:hypothetical protein